MGLTDGGRRALRWVVSLFDARDLHFYGGLALAFAGGLQLHPGWTMIATGAVLVAVGLFVGRPTR